MAFFRPSALEVYIASLPEEYQKIALQAIAEEINRIERCDYTTEELIQQKLAKALGTSMRRTSENAAANTIKSSNGSTPA